MKIIEPRSLAEIRNEWNGICQRRQVVIDEGRDVSLLSVTAPCILRHVQADHPKTVLDVGCGTGYLTSKIADYVPACVGIDCSDASIAIAGKHYRKPNLSFEVSEICKYVSDIEFDLCVANMVFMSDPTWKESTKHIHQLLVPKGRLYVMITHPCFWPKYWGYENQPRFHYHEETFFENDFSISLEKSMGEATFIHRPLAMYLKGLLSAGFSIEAVEEPFPVMSTPKGYQYSYPRFLFIKCQKRN